VTFADLKPLIWILADGQFHSGEDLGGRLGITRAAVWKRLQSLAELDIEVERTRARGYRINGGLQLLDRERILTSLAQPAGTLLGEFHCFDELDSTNRFLLQQGQGGDVCVAERQTAGRGRRGRQWFSPYGRNLYLSTRWHFDQGMAALEGLSLAVGVVLAESLQDLGVPAVELKWPNDLLCNRKKLGGVLIEVGGDLNGDCAVVVGVGLNVAMRDNLEHKAGALIQQPWTDLCQQGFEGDRNQLCGALIEALLPALKTYPERRFGFYKDRWESRSALRNQSIEVHSHGRVVHGVMLGVDATGGLRVITDAGEVLFSGGEISLRSSP
jgi:BirA family transcriptional regulator, biotin operon repressor / biotin---[acetyl-CoA-carboxylase] ligase